MTPNPLDPASWPEETYLVLVPRRDPLERKGEPGRSADYRLKLALKELGRKYGFEVRVCRPATPQQVAESTPLEDGT